MPCSSSNLLGLAFPAVILCKNFWKQAELSALIIFHSLEGPPGPADRLSIHFTLMLLAQVQPKILEVF